MELYKENLIHKIEDDLAGRNKNWEALENHIKNISDEYDPAKTYQIGDYAIYENTLYRCISETNGEWDSSAWVATSVAAEIVAHKAESAQKHITESRENANGRYIRFDDGTQICWYVGEQTVSIDNVLFSGLYYGLIFLNFPASFISSPAASIGHTVHPNSGASWGLVRGTSPTRVTINYLYPVSCSSASMRVSYIAIGRWK